MTSGRRLVCQGWSSASPLMATLRSNSMYHKHVLFQVQAEIDVINASWDSDGSSSNLADSLGLMVYEGTQALNYVKNYANGSGQWQANNNWNNKHITLKNF